MLIHKANIELRGELGGGGHSRRDLALGSLEAEAPPGGQQGVGLEVGGSAKASWLSGNKVNTAPDVCPGVEAISYSLPAHFIFQN